MTRHLAAWLADVLLGPHCPTRAFTGCRHRARGWRTQLDHVTLNHPGWEPAPR